MSEINFKIVHANGELAIVRNRKEVKGRRSSKAAVHIQSIKVQCFDSGQIEHIMDIQRGHAQKPRRKWWKFKFCLCLLSIQLLVL